jgi:hypothetical protein
MTAETIKARIETELQTAMRRLGGDPLQPLTYDAFALADAPPELLAIVGSIGDTMTDEQVLEDLLTINAGRPILEEGLSAEIRPNKLDG